MKLKIKLSYFVLELHIAKAVVLAVLALWCR